MTRISNSLGVHRQQQRLTTWSNIKNIYIKEININLVEEILASKICSIFTLTKGAFFWDYSGIGILGIDGICVLLGAIPFSE